MGQNQAVQIQGLGGNISALNVAAAGVVKNTPGMLFRIVVEVAPTAGNLTVNDLAANSGAAVANQIISVPFGSLVIGQVITLDWPCKNGIVVSSVGTGGVYGIAYS
jgi:hypothetical protein